MQMAMLGDSSIASVSCWGKALTNRARTVSALDTSLGMRICFISSPYCRYRTPGEHRENPQLSHSSMCYCTASLLTVRTTVEFRDAGVNSANVTKNTIWALITFYQMSSSMLMDLPKKPNRKAYPSIRWLLYRHSNRSKMLTAMAKLNIGTFVLNNTFLIIYTHHCFWFPSRNESPASKCKLHFQVIRVSNIYSILAAILHFIECNFSFFLTLLEKYLL